MSSRRKPAAPVPPAEIHSVVVGKCEMMPFYDPERIQGYCQTCEKYGVFWSCPPFSAPPLTQLPEWTHALLVTQKTPVTPGSTQEELITQFLSARQRFGERMKACEVEGAMAIIAGHCSGCSSCTRPRGLACGVPSKMRYSLEALGFDVTGLAEGLVGQKIHWPAHGMPDYLLTVGAVLCPTRELADRLRL